MPSRWRNVWRRYRERAGRNAQAGRAEPALEAFRWLVEELRVSLFAQELKTPVPVSFKRVERAWADLAEVGEVGTVWQRRAACYSKFAVLLPKELVC